MRKNLLTIALLLVLLASACSPRPAAPTTAPTQAQATEAPATQAPTEAATEAATSPTASSSSASTPSSGTQAATPGTGTEAVTPAAGTQAATPGAQVPATGAGTHVNLSSESGPLGSFLVDRNGMALYMFKGDTQNGTSSACSGDCLKTWSPLLTSGAPAAGDGVDASLLGTITRSSGAVQVTYNGWPLYHYLPDSIVPASRRGQPNGQGLDGQWFVMGADGNPITTAMSTATATGGTAASTGTPSP